MVRATVEEIQQRQTLGRVIRSMPFESLENALAQLPADTLAKLCLTDDPQREWLYRTAQVAPAGRALRYRDWMGAVKSNYRGCAARAGTFYRYQYKRAN